MSRPWLQLHAGICKNTLHSEVTTAPQPTFTPGTPGYSKAPVLLQFPSTQGSLLYSGPSKRGGQERGGSRLQNEGMLGSSSHLSSEGQRVARPQRKIPATKDCSHFWMFDASLISQVSVRLASHQDTLSSPRCHLLWRKETNKENGRWCGCCSRGKLKVGCCHSISAQHCLEADDA